METGCNGYPSPLQTAICRMVSSVVIRPMRQIQPFFSATGINWAGPILESFMRTSASYPLTSFVLTSTLGWYSI